MAKVQTYNKDYLDKRFGDTISYVSFKLKAAENDNKGPFIATQHVFRNGALSFEEKIYVNDLAKMIGGQNSENDARIEALENTVNQLITTDSPFAIGGRYYSVVSYAWPDYYLDQDDKAETVSKWNRFLSFGKALGIGILNRNSGNWDTFDNDFKTQGEIAKNKGIKRLVFYVKTQYGAASGIDFTGRTQIPNWNRYTKDYILGQIDKFVKQYGSLAEGVFLDEVINGWGDQANRIDWYDDLINSIKEKYGNQFFVVCNNGANIAPQLLKWKTDVFMTYEGTAENYLKENPNAPIHTADMAKEPGIRFWHVIHGVTHENYRKVFAKAAELGIGHVYVTDGVLDESGPGGQWDPVGNPYENPPSKQLEALIIPWINDYLPLYDKSLSMEHDLAQAESDISTLKENMVQVKNKQTETSVQVLANRFPTLNGMKNSNLFMYAFGLNVLTLTITVPTNAARYGVVHSISKTPQADLDFMMGGVDSAGKPVHTMMRVNTKGQIQYMYDPPKGETITGQAVWWKK